MRSIFLIPLCAAAILAGCADMSRKQQARTTGQIIGGAAGAVVGSQFGSGAGRVLATVAGGAIGAAAGGEAAASTVD